GSTYFTSSSSSFSDDGSSAGTAGQAPAVSGLHETQTTEAIDSGADASVVQSKLEALDVIGAGNVTVTSPTAGTYTIEFTGALANLDLPQLSIDTGNLTGTRAFFIKTGTFADGGTAFHAEATASATDLSFEARLGPFGLFVQH